LRLKGKLLVFLLISSILKGLYSEVRIKLSAVGIIEGKDNSIFWKVEGSNVEKSQLFWRSVDIKEVVEILKNYKPFITYVEGALSFNSSLYTEGKIFYGRQAIYIDNLSISSGYQNKLIQIVVYAISEGKGYYTYGFFPVINPTKLQSFPIDKPYFSDEGGIREIIVWPRSIIIHVEDWYREWFPERGWISYGPYI
jgi:hypothetical protein